MEEGRDGDTGERIPADRARSPARRLSRHGSGLQPAEAQWCGLDGEFVRGHVSRRGRFMSGNVIAHRVSLQSFRRDECHPRLSGTPPICITRGCALASLLALFQAHLRPL